MILPELPLLATAVVGSYPVSPWLARVKADCLARRIPAEEAEAIHDMAIKAAVKDQELAGVDVVTDGELRRDNLVDHFTVRLAGVELDREQKGYYYDVLDSVVRQALPVAPLRLVDEYAFVRGLTDRPVKFSVTGPHALVKRIRDEWYHDERAFALDLARVLNAELKALVAAGATFLQVDEPGLSGFPEDVGWAVEAVNALVDGVDATVALHVCYGNRWGRPSVVGSYRALFPAILKAEVDQLLLEFARTGTADLALFAEHQSGLTLGMGVIDVKDARVETPEAVAALVRRGLEVVPPERLWLNPDCGLHALSPKVANAKLEALVAGAALARGELEGTRA